MPGHGGFAQRGALRGLGKSHHRSAREPLQEALRPGVLHDLVRVAAAEGLGELTPHLERHEQAPAKEALEDALRDPHARVRRAAALALSAAGASERAEALSAYARTLPYQERVGIERLISKLGKQDADAAGKQLDGLRDKLRLLEERLSVLEARDAPAAPPAQANADGAREPK